LKFLGILVCEREKEKRFLLNPFVVGVFYSMVVLLRAKVWISFQDFFFIHLLGLV
jgi:hypothetical protein